MGEWTTGDSRDEQCGETYGERCGGLPSWRSSFQEKCCSVDALGPVERVCVGLGTVQQTDLNQVKRADEPISNPEPTSARDGVA